MSSRSKTGPRGTSSVTPGVAVHRRAPVRPRRAHHPVLFPRSVHRQVPVGEFVRQGAFMASTAVVPTILVALPIGVTLSVQFALLANQVGATSLAGAASGLAVIRQVPRWWPR